MCKNCQKSFSWKIISNKLLREKIWFFKWITEGYSVRQLELQSTYRHRKLRQIINYWLLQPPRGLDKDISLCKHLLFDGTYIFKRVGLSLLMEATSFTTIHGCYGISENSRPQVLQFLQELKDHGLAPISVTTDGNPHVIASFRELWPNIIVQRCVVHIQRQGLMWCRRYPKRTDAKNLRHLFLRVTNIQNQLQKTLFIKDVYAWERKYGEWIELDESQGYVFSDLKRARSMLLKALPYMFYYLDDPNIPISTNAVEGYFSRLKNHYRQHRGLAQHKRSAYFLWYLNLCPR